VCALIYQPFHLLPNVLNWFQENFKTEFAEKHTDLDAVEKEKPTHFNPPLDSESLTAWRRRWDDEVRTFENWTDSANVGLACADWNLATSERISKDQNSWIWLLGFETMPIDR
jgi:hypothetical protein